MQTLHFLVLSSLPLPGDEMMNVVVVDQWRLPAAPVRACRHRQPWIFHFESAESLDCAWESWQSVPGIRDGALPRLPGLGFYTWALAFLFPRHDPGRRRGRQLTGGQWSRTK